MKIVVSELLWPEGLAELRSLGEVVYDPGLWQRAGELRGRVGEAEALIVRNQTRVDNRLLRGAGRLRVVGRVGVGLDNIDLQAARKRGIKVVYARNANATSVAEYVLAAMLRACRELDAACEDVRAGSWDRARFTGVELCGKTLGLVGLGEISRRVARRAAAFGMRLLGYDPFVGPYDFPVAELGVRPVGLEELLESSDFVSLHLPLTPKTRNLLSLRELGRMRPEAWLINTSRGSIVNERALLEVLEKGAIGGAVLDVLEEEPPRPGSPLLSHERVLITPHVAGLTGESQVRSSVLVAREVGKVLRGESSLCVVGG
ncbi:MAG: hydroxyacid dehydrogenase [Rubrobacter sp.]|nr:hydroxyacid dehydrogenase [Rubrobacter sp.]